MARSVESSSSARPCVACPLKHFARMRWIASFLTATAVALALAWVSLGDEAPAPAAPGHDQGTGGIERRLAAVARRVREAAAQHPEILRRHPDLYALALLQVEKAELALQNDWLRPYGDDRARAFLEKAEQLITPLLAGREPALPRTGRIELAYLAPNDRSAQPYQLYVPPSYDGSTAFGLLVYLHGYSPSLNKENWVDYMYADVLEDYCRQAGYILLMPFARGNTDFQGAGEDDVMLAIERTMRRYRIDPDRVVLSGYSMGGMGVWTIGGHYPDRFAALLAMSGRGDFYLWKGIRPEELPWFRRKLIEQEFGANLLPNYRHLPVFLMHGIGAFRSSSHDSCIGSCKRPASTCATSSWRARIISFSTAKRSAGPTCSSGSARAGASPPLAPSRSAPTASSTAAPTGRRCWALTTGAGLRRSDASWPRTAVP